MTVGKVTTTPPSIYDAARVVLILAGVAGFGWGLVTQQPPTTFAVVLSGVGALMAYTTSEQNRGQSVLVSDKASAISDKVDVIKKATDGMSTALVASTAKASFAEGVASTTATPPDPAVIAAVVKILAGLK